MHRARENDLSFSSFYRWWGDGKRKPISVNAHYRGIRAVARFSLSLLIIAMRCLTTKLHVLHTLPLTAWVLLAMARAANMYVNNNKVWHHRAYNLLSHHTNRRVSYEFGCTLSGTPFFISIFVFFTVHHPLRPWISTKLRRTMQRTCENKSNAEKIQI